jgi:transcriptional regulator with XRE-family HTH domain
MSDEGNTEVEVVQDKPKNKGGRPKGAKRSIKRLQQMEVASIAVDYARGIPQKEIARKLGVSDSAITLVLDKFRPFFQELGNVEEYRQAKADILDSLQLQTLKAISNPERIETAPLNQLAYTYDILTKHGRLERGQSTSNVATQTVTVTLAADDYPVTDN